MENYGVEIPCVYPGEYKTRDVLEGVKARFQPLLEELKRHVRVEQTEQRIVHTLTEHAIVLRVCRDQIRIRGKASVHCFGLRNNFVPRIRERFASTGGLIANVRP